MPLGDKRKELVSRAALFSFWLFIFMIPFRSAMGHLHSPARTILLLVMALFIAVRVADGKWRPFPADRPFFLFSAVMALSSIFSFDVEYSLSAYVRTLLPMMILYLTGSRLIDGRTRLMGTALVIVVSSILALGAGFVFHERTDGRLEGLFEWPTRLGKYLDLVIPLTISLALAGPGHMVRTLSGTALLIQAAALVSSSTRGAFIGIGLSCTPFLAMKRGLIPIAAAVLAALSIFLLMAPEEITHRDRIIETVTRLPMVLREDAAMNQRFEIYKTTLLLIRQRPVLGWGYGNHIEKLILEKRGYDWLRSQGIDPPEIYHAHNLPLEIALEGGLLALAAAVWLWVEVAVMGIRLMMIGQGAPDASSTRSTAILGSGFFLGLTALFIHGFVTVPQWANSTLAVAYMSVVVAAARSNLKGDGSP